jgi:uncharacterized iron-regulated membrane protein
MMLVVGLAAAVVVVALVVGVAVWRRRHRDRRDFEGHFQHEWDQTQRWASLAEGDQEQQKTVGSE